MNIRRYIITCSDICMKLKFYGFINYINFKFALNYMKIIINKNNEKY